MLTRDPRTADFPPWCGTLDCRNAADFHTRPPRRSAGHDYGVEGFALTYGWKELPQPKRLREFGDDGNLIARQLPGKFWRSLELT